MKIFYSIILAFIFIFHGDAQPGILILPKQSFLNDTTDSTITVPPDSSATVKDSIVAVSESISDVNEEIIAPKKTKNISGVASFYSKKLEGTKTATGETFHHTYYTAASNNFPLNTWLRVTNIKNCKSVIVRVNDRMHPKMARKGRVVDLTIAAAKKIGLTSKIGITKVEVEEVEKGTDDEQ